MDGNCTHFVHHNTAYLPLIVSPTTSVDSIVPAADTTAPAPTTVAPTADADKLLCLISYLN